MAGLVGIAKGKLSPAHSDRLGASCFEEPISPCVPIGVCVKENLDSSVQGLGRWEFISQILICVKLIIISAYPHLTSETQTSAVETPTVLQS